MEKLVQAILKKNYYLGFPFNYYPIIAIACRACRVPYVSWTYDSPFIQLYSKTLEYEINFSFIFDRGTLWESLSNIKERLEPYDKGYIDALAAVQKSIYAYNFLEEIAFRSACILWENRDTGSEKLWEG